MLEALVSGLLQGLLEWLPVSSSGQVSLVLMGLLGVSPDYAYRFSLFLHLGTAFSAIAWFRGRLLEALRGGEVLGFLVYSYAASLAVGGPVYLAASGLTADRLTLVIGVLLVATGLLLEASRRGEGARGVPRPLDAVLVGVAQGFAVLPGLSRSAVTIAVLALRGYGPETAVEYSFIASIPVTVTAGLYEALGGAVGGLEGLIALVAAFTAGTASLGFMVGLARRARLGPFLAALGLLILALYFPVLSGIV